MITVTPKAVGKIRETLDKNQITGGLAGRNLFEGRPRRVIEALDALASGAEPWPGPPAAGAFG